MGVFIIGAGMSRIGRREEDSRLLLIEAYRELVEMGADPTVAEVIMKIRRLPIRVPFSFREATTANIRLSSQTIVEPM